MAWRGGAGSKGGKSGKGKKGKQPAEDDASVRKEPDYLKPVDARWELTKAALRPYASPTGSPFYASQGQSDADFLSLANLRSKQEPYNTEMVNRMGIALSEVGGTVGMAKELLDKYAADPAATAEKLGIQAVAELFGTDDGKAFQEAAATFNKHNEEKPKAHADLQAAAHKFLAFLQTDSKAKATKLRRAAKSSATLYLTSMALLQLLAIATNPTEWANKMKATKALQPEEVQKWLRKPSDPERLVAALVSSYLNQIQVLQKKTVQNLSDSEGPSPPSVAAEEDAASSSASSSEDKKSKDKKDKKSKDKKSKDKKDKKNKDKKDKKSKDKKDKKTKKSKKKQGSSSSSSSDNSSVSAVSATAAKKKAKKSEGQEEKEDKEENKEENEEENEG